VERRNLTEVVQHWENAEGTSHKLAKHTDWKSKRSHNVSH